MTLCGSHCARYASSPKRVNRVSRDAFTHFPPVPDLGTKLFPRTSAQGAQELAIKEPLLGGFLYSKILNQPTFERSLAFLLATKLATSTILASQWNDLIIDAITTSAEEEQNKSPGAGSIAARRLRARSCIPDRELFSGGSTAAAGRPHKRQVRVAARVEHPPVCQRECTRASRRNERPCGRRLLPAQNWAGT